MKRTGGATTPHDITVGVALLHRAAPRTIDLDLDFDLGRQAGGGIVAVVQVNGSTVNGGG